MYLVDPNEYILTVLCSYLYFRQRCVILVFDLAQTGLGLTKPAQLCRSYHQCFYVTLLFLTFFNDFNTLICANKIVKLFVLKFKVSDKVSAPKLDLNA